MPLQLRAVLVSAQSKTPCSVRKFRIFNKLDFLNPRCVSGCGVGLCAVLVSPESDSVSDPTQSLSILDFFLLNFLTPHSVSQRGVTYFVNIFTK